MSRNLNLVYVHCEKQCTARKLGRSLLAFSRFIDFLLPPFYEKRFYIYVSPNALLQCIVLIYL